MANGAKRLIDAGVLERENGILKSSAYKLAKSGLIPSYRVGPRLRGVRFVAEEVLQALRRPAPAPRGDDSA